MGHGLNISGVHRQNRRLILRLILQNPQISRIQLAERTHLTPASVSNITRALINEQYIQEVGTLDEIRSIGRRAIGLRIRNGHYRTVAVHMQRRQITIGLGELDGSVTQTQSLAIPDHPHPEHLAKHIGREITKLVSTLTGSHIVGIGVGTSGIVDTDTGMVNAALAYQWQNVPWAALLSQETGLPVAVDNNARGMALGEMLFGGQDASAWLVFFYVGQGIGVGAITNGQVFRGPNGIGGELGHMTINWQGEVCWCGNVGCLETYLNQAHIEALLNVTDGESLVTALQRWYQRGPYFDLIDWITTAMVAIVNMFNPRQIVLGGWLADVWSRIEHDVVHHLKRRTRFWSEPAPQIRPAAWGIDVGLRGANAVALSKWVYDVGVVSPNGSMGDQIAPPEETV
ncbi:Sugar kinase of the NBD/HSP70 family, may contain an N-terminal HTH domain [Sulfobacillus thermosulfidooxidans DSM 9293]|uniref:Sugar kinase of the NBD/HSP70 family, may contain an N-terminal HTH domain n=1 Tax=Sulfobacillus thermosulfidooxidans (strain DSM 9293 / VKM B-1269 / AT-1) TaxID=929705 RepID=A0A1W1WPR5_SULTA|nr:ROK family transcriptional regulator [Sulfobacillus thermosulfidooxidans]SMC08226.1 Sugar kinase of the NBD/HSP70 family, may contain an N-terminal HTH domain [Sulfobacillus thermosulfidooxidans DSM 9293]